MIQLFKLRSFYLILYFTLIIVLLANAKIKADQEIKIYADKIYIDEIKNIITATGDAIAIDKNDNKIKADKSGNQLSFKMDRLGYVVIRFSQDQDFTKRLVLIFETPEVVPDKTVNIVDEYGIDNSGQINETSKIQMALNNISGSEKHFISPLEIIRQINLSLGVIAIFTLLKMQEL